jgi:hypothetical protein
MDMKRRPGWGKAGNFLVCSVAAILLCVSLAHAQSAGTGAIAGTVTDPSGAAVAGAKVTLTSLATAQTRTATTGPNGDYRFSLLPPGNYRLDFSASGFKTATIASVTVTTTETATVNQALEVGTVTQTVTVESNAQVLQTESATLGGTVSGAQIRALPMANGNYTEILSLAPGTAAPVDNATAIGKGTQDISANGVDPGSNNFMMDGVAVDNIANSGSANDGTIYTGIPIPSPDAIQEFKVQTSAYDASYGRNPGAIVNVTTRSGTNQFHGSAFEFFRNTALNANNFFLKESQLASGVANKPPVFNQNQFGATIGGPIKKNKLFFFFSYRGTRASNAAAPQGQDFGAILGTSPQINNYAALGSRGTCPSPAALPDTLTVANCDATAQAFAKAMGIANNNIVGLRLFQLTTGTAKNPTAAGVPNNYYLPSPVSDPQFCNATTGVCNFDIPAIYTENQYVANSDWIINSKETLSTKYFYSHNPYTSYLGEAGGDLPGTPEDIIFGNHAAQIKLTSLVSNTFVNEAIVSFQRNVNAATAAVPPGGCPNAGNLPAPYGCGSPSQLGMKPLDQNFYEPFSTINIGTGYGLFGGLLPDQSPTNQLEAADQISWQHGKHTIRAGFSNQWTNWPITDQGLQQGLMLFTGYGSFLGSGINCVGPGCPGGFQAWNFGCLFCVKGTTPTGNTANITHFYQDDNRDAYIQDDWKVSSRLTINMGLRWEFDGLITDKYGNLTQVWLNRMVANSALPTSPLAATSGPFAPLGVQQYSVPSNFQGHYGPPAPGVGLASNRYNIQGHAPYSDFAPRFGFAWQPIGDKLVIRGGAGIFYDRIGLDRIVHAFEQGYPYAATYDFGGPGSPRWAQSTLADPYPQIQLVCLPSDPGCNSEPFGQGFAAAWFDPATGASSGLNTPYDPVTVHTPLVRSYSLGIQYEFDPGWVLSLGYVGSSGINLTDIGHNHNGAQLITPSNDPYGICSAGVCNTATNVQYRVPYVGYEAIGLQASDFNGVSNYNSLQASVQHQFSQGLSFQAAYTWDKNLSDVFIGNSADINNALCMRCQYGRVNFDRPQRLVVNYTYDLPFGQHQQGILGHAIGGWEVSGVTIAQSGDPLTFIDPAAGSAYGTNTGIAFQGVGTAQYCQNMGNANALGSGSVWSRVVSGQYFNPKAFCAPPTLASGAPFYGDGSVTGWGNSGVGVVLGPGQFNWDISLAKNTNITERVRMQFRADFYNAFNHAQFADPGSGGFGTVGFENISAANFGQITSLSVNPRLIQFGLHFFF